MYFLLIGLPFSFTSPYNTEYGLIIAQSVRTNQKNKRGHQQIRELYKMSGRLSTVNAGRHEKPASHRKLSHSNKSPKKQAISENIENAVTAATYLQSITKKPWFAGKKGLILVLPPHAKPLDELRAVSTVPEVRDQLSINHGRVDIPSRHVQSLGHRLRAHKTVPVESITKYCTDSGMEHEIRFFRSSDYCQPWLATTKRSGGSRRTPELACTCSRACFKNKTK